jgi:hypothetical protein
VIAAYIKRADKLTESPKIEYSLLEPLVPTTPVNTIPVVIPTEHEQLILFSSLTISKALKTPLAGSS